MHNTLVIAVIGAILLVSTTGTGEAQTREQEMELLRSLEVTADQLKPLRIDTPIVAGGQPTAVICHAQEPTWRQAARDVQAAIREATGVEVPIRADDELSFAQADATNVILLGRLENSRHAARLYHNFYVRLDLAYAGDDGYVIRSVHDPWGAGNNYILVGGSTDTGVARAAEAFARIVADAGTEGALTLGRQMILEIGEEPISDEERDAAIERGRNLFAAPGEGRSAVSQLVRAGTEFHRTGDRNWGEVYRALMHALIEHYETDPYISTEPLSRYDREFRDAWTWEVGILWDLNEEADIFTDEERLAFTNMVMRLMLECDLYQHYEAHVDMWRENTNVPHNHNTFPALGAYFVGEYFLRHYGDDALIADRARMWLDVAEGVFRWLKHSYKPLEDAAAYLWLPLMHVQVYSLAQGDTTWYDEGHGREVAEIAMITMDNAGYQAAYGDHSAYKANSATAECLFKIAWYYRDPEILWMTEKAGGTRGYPLRQLYPLDIEPQPPTDHIGLRVAKLPESAYNEGITSSPYPTEPQVPLDKCFNKAAFRAGLDADDAYMLLDGFGRGTHMHWDANAIIRYAHGGEPLLVDGEYILNSPKYHNSLVIIRDGRSENAPAVTELVAAEQVDGLSYLQTRLPEYNGSSWTRSIVWRPNDYVLVSDEVEALQDGDFTLRCCWRPWGDAQLEGGTLTVEHRPMLLQVINADGAPSSIEEMKVSANMPIWRLSQQVTRQMRVGESYRFINVIHSHDWQTEREVTARRVGPGLVVVERPEGAEVIALGPEGLASAGIEGDASLVLIGEDLLVTNGTTSLSPQGACRLTDLPEAAAEVRERVLAMPAEAAPVTGDGIDAPGLNTAWEAGGFEPPMETLPVASVTADKEHHGRYGPIDKLVDGQYTSSYGSVQWGPGETVTITAELMEPTQISAIILREWQMNEEWIIGDRRLQISSDGFKNDVRDLGSAFELAGTESWGSNVNTLMRADIAQEAQQIRLTLSPRDAEARVYLAELEIRGTEPGARAKITAIASSDLAGDGSPAVVVGAESGELRAFSADGDVLWEVDSEQQQINDIACIDLDGDGRDEVVFGTNSATLGLISPDGELQWQVTPPKYRGIDSDVMTIVPADVDGDGLPEIVIGCRSWTYLAYDAEGEMLWQNIIYAHSATVGHADDFDGDGLPEIVGGNAYYRLNLIDQDGKRIFNAGRFGPEQTAVGSADIDDDGLPEILMGTDLGELLAFDNADGSTIWEQNVGDRVTAIIPADLDGDGGMEIVVGAESANVYAFDRDGGEIWRTVVPGGVSDLLALPGPEPRFAAAVGSGVAIIDAGGQIIAMGETQSRALKLALLDGRIAVSTAGGLVEALELP